MNIFDNSNIKGMIFDLDGTLLDSMSIWRDVDIKYLARHGIVYDESFSEEIKTMTFDESAIYFIEKFHIQKSTDEIKAEWNEMVEEEYRDHVPLKEGVLAYLEEVKRHNIKACIATSCNIEHAKMALKRLKIDNYFEFILTCKEVGKNKMFPNIYLKCAERLNVNPNQCIVYEDLHGALMCAKNAGFYTVGIKDVLNNESISNVCDIYINSFIELLK